MSELLEGQLHLRTLARRKAALPQVLVLQPRNTRTHTHAHTTQLTQFAGGGWKRAVRVRAGSQESESSAARRRDDSGQLAGFTLCVCASFLCMNLLVYIQEEQIAAFPI